MFSNRLLRVFRFLLVFLFGFLFGFLLLLWIQRIPVFLDPNYGKIDLNNTNPDVIIIETLCSKKTSTCYSVAEIIDRKTSVVQRRMYKNNFENGYLEIIAELIPPIGMTHETSDTRLWDINTTVTTTQYVAAIITHLFAISSLPFNDKRELLFIGGSRNVDIFLHSKFPNINITIFEEETVVVQLRKRWFRVVEGKTRNMITKDGVAEIFEAKKLGRKYDTVILDVCENSKEISCPAKKYLAKQVLTEIKHILKPTGTFIVNIWNSKNQISNVDKIIKTILSHFAVCIKMKLSNESNIVVSCLPYPLGEKLKYTEQNIHLRVKNVSNTLGIYEILENSDLTIVSK